MIRQFINIDNFKYMCEMYEYNEMPIEKDFTIHFKHIVEDNFVYFKSAYVSNDISDKDIFFPVNETNNAFSKQIEVFNNNVDFKSSIYDESGMQKKLKCNTLRIYHPLSKTKSDNTIVHIYAYVKGKQIHLMCKEYEAFANNSYTELQYNNETYSEYIEISFPDFDDFISKQTYYEDSFAKSTINGKFEFLIKDIDGKQLCSTYLFNAKYANHNNLREYKIPDYENTESYFGNPIYVDIVPYETYDKQFNASYNVGTAMFSFVPRMTLSNTVKIDSGILKSFMKFNYPDRFSSLKEAYQYYYNIDFSEYTGIYYDEDDENYNETEDHKQHQCVYMFQISDDPSFRNILYSSESTEMMSDEVEDKTYPIPYLWKSWKEKPDLTVCRWIYVDRYIGLTIISNICVISDEMYKYIIKSDNNDKSHRLNTFDMEQKINFYDKVKCSIIKHEEQKAEISNSQRYNTIYKPIFYKVQDLQNIQLRNGIVQNIGINLGNYMTKIANFYIVIDGKKILEHARNDIYVIFKIDASTINTTNGVYSIYDQDMQYISSGNYSII